MMSLAEVEGAATCLPRDTLGFADLAKLEPLPSYVWGIIAALSLLLPLAIFLGINNVRAGRKGLIQDLETLFSSGGEQDYVVQSFEMLKYRYEGDPARSDSARMVVSYLVPVFLFVILCLIGFGLSFLPIIPDCKGANRLSPLVNPTGTLVGSLAYTFFGAYLWSIGHLIRRVSNYDLSPISFLQAAWHLLLAVFVSAALWHAHLFESRGQNFLVGVAFLIGWFPDLFLGALIAKFPWLTLRRVGPETKKLREDLPLDTILGIDSFIKLRLNEYEIMDVQNLATANPIKIFVETPYGLLEAIDWVAQAQLILAVGSANVVELRKQNIRTIFDLEKGVRNRTVNARLLAILREQAPRPATAPVADGAGSAAVEDGREAATDDEFRFDRYRANTERVLDLDDELATFVAIIRDDLHVRRLRQIWDIVNSRLNDRATVPIRRDEGGSGLGRPDGIRADGAERRAQA